MFTGFKPMQYEFSYQRKEEVRRMNEKLYGVNQFNPGDFAPILTGVYRLYRSMSGKQS